MAGIIEFSAKQKQLLGWWHPRSPCSGYDAVICDGAVRSGKTYCMSLSFVLWAMHRFHGMDFALCAKTITALRRNVVTPLVPRLESCGFRCRQMVSGNYFEVSADGNRNRFYLFGGRDESSAALIQGITLAGVFFDETVLMPQSFVEQALARCSVPGSRFWFNCNPGHPGHWFYREWIEKRRKKNALYLHVTMADNPSLTPQIRRRYESLYSGVFYRRYIQGQWTAAAGLVYPMFDPKRHVFAEIPQCRSYYISCDYGTVNPMSMGLWGLSDGVWHRIGEYYYDSRREGCQQTDEDYYEALERLADGREIEAVVADPSAASFLACIRRHGKYRAIRGKNAVTDGIRRVADALRDGIIRFHTGCTDTLREFGLYAWEDGTAQDTPKKCDDHAMDDVRYFVNTVLDGGGEEAFFVLSARRG